MITPFQEGSVGDVVFNLSVDAIVVMNARGQIVGWNPAAEALFGWLLDEPSLELRWESAWTQPGADVRPFTAAGIEAGIREGEGLLGRAWQQRAGVRGELVGESEARRRAAEACGLGTGLTAPILGGDVALGVVSFFRPGGESPIDAIALEV